VARSDRPLTPRQQHVLCVLANRGASAITEWGAWWPQVRGIIDRLARVGYVDVAGFDGRSRTYKITSAGLEAIDGIDEIDEDSL
jgi:predicted transcriptional regulator